MELGPVGQADEMGRYGGDYSRQREHERGWLLGCGCRFSALASEGTLPPYTKGTTEFQDDRWYHVAGTYDAEITPLACM